MHLNDRRHSQCENNHFYEESNGSRSDWKRLKVEQSGGSFEDIERALLGRLRGRCVSGDSALAARAMILIQYTQ